MPSLMRKSVLITLWIFAMALQSSVKRIVYQAQGYLAFAFIGFSHHQLLKMKHKGRESLDPEFKLFEKLRPFMLPGVDNI